MRKVTVPFFISHQGCPHTCVFCDQRTISGSSGYLPTSVEILEKIELWAGTSNGSQLEVAFFGGTFTALPVKIQTNLLAPLQPLLNAGKVGSVRISTRPDYVDADHVKWLSGMGVTTIELGIQSLDNKVLAASGRGHCGEDSLRAIACIKAAGLTVGAQLMPGLPGDTPASSFASLEQVITAGADFLRIYPTVVLKGTELARQYLAGEFVPLSLELGVSLCCLMLHRAAQAGIPVIRIGLQADEGLNAENVLAGCWHPALGQLVRSRLYADLIDRFVMSGNNATIFCHPSRLSDVVGLKRCNVQNQASRGVTMSVVTDNELSKEQLRVEVEGNIAIYSIFKDNNYSIKEV